MKIIDRIRDKKQMNTNEKGQVLILIVIVMVILMLAILFMFDLQTVIRGKMKLETAEQAAVLTSAKWQMESLNLIGELNMIKACDILTSDIVPLQPDDSENKIKSAVACVTEMQARISFIGPLIGFGASQQAAKNNGADSKTSSIRDTVNSYIYKLNGLDYAVLRETPIQGYDWFDPYVNMLTEIASQGLVARPNGRSSGIVNPYYFKDASFYDAIMREEWCNRILNWLIKKSDDYWLTKWWEVEFMNNSFPSQSEILTLHIDYSNLLDDYDKENIKNLLSENEMLETLDEVKWCVYDNTWGRGNYNSPNGSYTGPNPTGDNVPPSMWGRGGVLRADLKSSFLYGGALAYAECRQSVKLLSKYDGMKNIKNSSEKAAFIKEQDLKSKNRRGLKDNNSIEIGGGDALVGAVAKAIGFLGGKDDGLPPSEVNIILPVFNTVALIPTYMQTRDLKPLSEETTALEIFVQWLEDIDDLNDNGNLPPMPDSDIDPAAVMQYLEVLRKLSDPNYRKKGYNNDFNVSEYNYKEFFYDDYKYDSETNPRGAGWLQQIYTETYIYVSDPDNLENEPAESESDNYKKFVFKGKIIYQENGRWITNEDRICHRNYGSGSSPRTGTGVTRF